MKSLIPLLLIAIPLLSFSQTETKYNSNSTTLPAWVKLMYQNEDAGAIIKAHDDYYDSHPFVKSNHTQFYKRWKRSLARNINYNERTARSWEKYIEASTADHKSASSQWQCVGPIDFDKEAASASYAAGAAHVYTVEKGSANTSVVYAGTATAGLWKSTDNGLNWLPLTYNMITSSIVAIEVDKSNEDIVYMGNNGNFQKSIDGGATWADMGNAPFSLQSHDITDIVSHASAPQQLFVASNHGLYKTTDGGATFTQLMTGRFLEIEYHPTDPTIIYFVREFGSKTDFFRSIDNGVTLQQQSAGWPTPAGSDEQKRTEISVSAAAPDNVYALATGEANGGTGLYGIYVSTDQGMTWNFQCCGAQPGGVPAADNMNLTGWSDEGLDDGGQYYYDLALDVNPADANEIHVGAVNHWISTDQGQNFACPSKWSHSQKVNYVHADIHDIRYYDDELWVACDGGIFFSGDNGATFNRRMFGIAGTDFWGFDASFQDGDVMLGGAYHNGTMLKNGDTYDNGWICTDGGDGIRGYANFGDKKLCYSDYGGKRLSDDRTVPIQSLSFDSLPNASYIEGESSKLAFDYSNNEHIYLGRNNLLLETWDNGMSFNTIHTFDHMVTNVEVSKVDPNYIYATTYEDWWGEKNVWRSTDKGVTWTNITPDASVIATEQWVAYEFTLSGDDENKLWLARTSQSGDSPNLDGNMVYETSDGGNTWTNITTATLDGESLTCIVHQHGTDNGIYLGTRRAVYYRSDNTDWILFNDGLPIVTTCVNLVPNYDRGVLINGTNRSAWEIDFYETSSVKAQIAADTYTANCLDQTVQYWDHSIVNSQNATYTWSFPGGTPDASTARNPLVTYDTPGVYAVSLTVSDGVNSDSQVYTQFITYDDGLTSPNLSEDFTNSVPDTWYLRNADETFNWSAIDVFYGPDCEPTRCVTVNNFDINAVGTEGALMTPIIDFSNVPDATLTFDYAFANYGAPYDDGMRVDISTDCGTTWTELWSATGPDLATAGSVSSWWEPTTCDEWDSLAIDLSAYANTEAMIRFVIINAFGNNIYMDNVNFSGSLTGVAESIKTSPRIYPNPSSGRFNIEYSGENYQLIVTDVQGRLVLQQNNPTSFELDTPGIYNARVIGNVSQSYRIVVTK